MDPIRRQLRLLDARLHARSHPGQWLFTRSPLLLPASALILGICFQHFFDAPIILPLLLFGLGALSTVIMIALRPKNYLLILTAAVYLCFASLGMIRLKSYYTPAANDIRNLVPADRTLATIRGIVKTTPKYENRKSWRFGRYQFMPPGCSFYLSLEQVKTDDHWADVRGIVRVQLSGQTRDIQPGDRIQAYCRLSRFAAPLNPGQFDMKKSMERRNIYVAATVNSLQAIEIIEKAAPSSFRRITSRIRTIASEALLDDNLADDDASPLLAALLLGQRSDIDTQTSIAFQKTNLAHFISLSGMHLGILAATLWWLCKTVGLPKRLRAVACAAAIALYILIVPPRAPTLRAAVICWVFCLAVLVRRKPYSLNTLAVAAIVLLLIKPTDLFTAGWQLSYTTVLGILLLQQPIANWILERTLDRLPTRQSPGSNNSALLFWSTSLLHWAIQLFATGMAAWLGGAGILLYHFGTIGPMASLWTVLVFPLVWLILVLGFLKMILVFLLPTLSLIIGLALAPLANSLAAFVRLLADTGISQIIIGEVAASLVICYYAFVLLLRFKPIEQHVPRRILYVSMIALIVFPLAAVKYSRTHAKHLELTTLSVGHGQAILITLPDSRNILFDAGSLGAKNPGGRVVVPFLTHKGINAIDTLIVSHADSDHINGIPEIVAACNVRRICANPAVLQKASTTSMAGYLSYCLKSLNHEIEALPETLDFKSNATIQSLWPDPNSCQDPLLSDNNKSQVILIEFAGRKILLTSDIELNAQEQLLKLYPDLQVDVLVMPHHGSKRNLLDSFAQKLRAQTVIISCSHTRRRTAYEPHPPLRALYTPVHGAITTKIKPNGDITTTSFIKPE